MGWFFLHFDSNAGVIFEKGYVHGPRTMNIPRASLVIDWYLRSVF